ncbi:hypothetical protein SAMN00768000_0225 [Sulfobacillus thermosulfidooxidans DSM 9293]|uniref:Uncharacterized protein n=1 Tax=Sulfobacillus thermosulfidooxidans (strain DSM 9293 / VKM B-1269 / AT-1) TaxID=929705 RepID=A0A1W1W6W0_SULTA|nr:hypothetical protein [Sulfobacillus thermosulfidooxidans]SMC02016.1 hypothetical protein SAMN00768000_0225 [Sulfobacillus thermosulfidooxidans DSM 9293]
MAVWDGQQWDAEILRMRIPETRPMTTRERIAQHLRHVLAPWCEREAPLTWRWTNPGRSPEQRHARIQALTSEGVVLEIVDGVTPWRTFVSWIDLWAEHVHVVTPATCDHDIQTARSRLQTLTVVNPPVRLSRGPRKEQNVWISLNG